MCMYNLYYMNAFQACQTVVANYQEHMNIAFEAIKERAAAGFYSARMYGGVWCVDSDLNRRVRQELDIQGYNTSFVSDKRDVTCYTLIEWY